MRRGARHLPRLAMLAAGSVALVSPLRLTFAEEKDLPIPPDLRPAIERAIELGRGIYLQDKASAIATDALAAELGPLEGKGLGGYLTVPIYVGTKRGIWYVDRGSIRLVSADAPRGEGK